MSDVEGSLAAELVIVQLPNFEGDRDRAVVGVFKVLDPHVLGVLFFRSLVFLLLFLLFCVVFISP